MNQPTMPVSKLVTGQNYRRRFDVGQMTELEESIRTQGLHTPITVRPIDNGDFFQVIAGHRRLMAFKAVYGAESAIPVFVRMLSDAEAKAAMVAENKVRADTTAIEDAEAASDLLGMLNGDRDETARRLGWNRQLLDRRLALMNAAQSVRDAYIEDKIQLGHVEILATLRREVQDHVLGKSLESVAAGNSMPSVAEFKELTQRFMLNLELAIFDKTECASCAQNTGTTMGLFETSFDGANCTNKACYDKKTESELQTRAESLKSEYQVVRIVRPGDNATLGPLRIGGDKGVSEAQGTACKQCKDFGACVSAIPNKLGSVFKNVCFDMSCNAEKVKANQKEVAQANAEKQKAEKSVEQRNASKTAMDGQAPEVESDTQSKATKKAEALAKVSGNAAEIKARNQIVEYREGLWRKVLSKACEKLTPQQAYAVLVGICVNQPARINSLALKEKLKAQGFEAELNLSESVSGAIQMDESTLLEYVKLLCTELDSTTSIHDVTGLLKVLNVDISKFWKITDKFLSILTKAEIDAICVEVGIDKAMGTEYAKAKNGGKEDFVKAVGTVQGFTYVGAIPKIVRWN